MLGRALALTSTSVRPFELARTQLALGEALRRSGQRVDARTHLRAALERFDNLGATVWAERSREQLGAWRCSTQPASGWLPCAAPRPAVTIEHAWRGIDYGDDALSWWALAIGRADDDAPLSVTFTGRLPSRQRSRTAVPRRTALTPAVVGGLWVAPVSGLQFAVTCRQKTRQHVRRLAPLPGRWPTAISYDEEVAG